jgi:hypothetical protein
MTIKANLNFSLPLKKGYAKVSQPGRGKSALGIKKRGDESV